MRKIHTIFIVTAVVGASPLQAGWLAILNYNKPAERRRSDVNLKDLLGEMILSGNVAEFKKLQQSKEFPNHYVYCAEKITIFVDQKSIELMELLIACVGSKIVLDQAIHENMGYGLDRMIAMSRNFWLETWLLDQGLQTLNHPVLEDAQGDSIRRLYCLDLAISSPRMYPINDSPNERTSRGSS